MTLPDVATIKRAMTPAEPSAEQLMQVVGCCERRFLRADEKLAAAAAECNDASSALRLARAALAQFIAENPDPQLAMPI
jgi:hypothetical protein